MRKYIVSFWDSAQKSWPTVEAYLRGKGAIYNVGKVAETVVVECPEETALLLRDHDDVMSLLPVDVKPGK